MDVRFDFLDFDDELSKLEVMYRKMADGFQRLENNIPCEPDLEDFFDNVQEVQNSKLEVQRLDADFNRMESELERERKEILKLKQEGESINKVAEESLRLTEEKSTQLRRIKSDLAALKEKDGQSDQVFSKKRDKMEVEISREQSALSLELVRTKHGSLILNFTNIDRHQPDKKFVCEIRVVGGKYEAMFTEPSIPDIDKLISTLNNSADISGFAVTLRKRFQSLKE